MRGRVGVCVWICEHGWVININFLLWYFGSLKRSRTPRRSCWAHPVSRCCIRHRSTAWTWCWVWLGCSRSSWIPDSFLACGIGSRRPCGKTKRIREFRPCTPDNSLRNNSQSTLTGRWSSRSSRCGGNRCKTVGGNTNCCCRRIQGLVCGCGVCCWPFALGPQGMDGGIHRPCSPKQEWHPSYRTLRTVRLGSAGDHLWWKPFARHPSTEKCAIRCVWDPHASPPSSTCSRVPVPANKPSPWSSSSSLSPKH